MAGDGIGINSKARNKVEGFAIKQRKSRPNRAPYHNIDVYILILDIESGDDRTAFVHLQFVQSATSESDVEPLIGKGNVSSDIPRCGKWCEVIELDAVHPDGTIQRSDDSPC